VSVYDVAHLIGALLALGGFAWLLRVLFDLERWSER
jgi:hypothetical protein